MNHISVLKSQKSLQKMGADGVEEHEAVGIWKEVLSPGHRTTASDINT